MPHPHQFIREIGDHAFRSAIQLRRDTFIQRSHLCNSHGRLPNKGDLVVTYQGATQKGGPKRYIVDLSIQRQGSALLPLLQVNATPGEMMFAAIPGFRNGVLVIGVKIVP